MSLYWNDFYNQGTGLFGSQTGTGDITCSNIFCDNSINQLGGGTLLVGDNTLNTRIGKTTGNTTIQSGLIISGNTTLSQFSSGILQTDTSGRVSSSHIINANNIAFNQRGNISNINTLNFDVAGSLTGVVYPPPFVDSTYMYLNTPYGIVANGQNNVLATEFVFQHYFAVSIDSNLQLYRTGELGKPLQDTG